MSTLASSGVRSEPALVGLKERQILHIHAKFYSNRSSGLKVMAVLTMACASVAIRYTKVATYLLLRADFSVGRGKDFVFISYLTLYQGFCSRANKNVKIRLTAQQMQVVSASCCCLIFFQLYSQGVSTNIFLPHYIFCRLKHCEQLSITYWSDGRVVKRVGQQRERTKIESHSGQSIF